MSDFSSTPQERLQKRDKEMVPIVLVRAMFFLALMTVAMVAFARYSDAPRVGIAQLPAITAETEIWFNENPEQRGSYLYKDASGRVLASSADAKGGFLAAMGRTIERRRMLEKANSGAPITIVRRENGRVAILDPASSFEMELMGYGSDNIAAFAQFLPAKEAN